MVTHAVLHMTETTDAVHAVDVLPADRARWQRALDHARSAGMPMQRCLSIDTFDVEMTGYVVTDDGRTFNVGVARNHEGYVWTLCPCLDGVRGVPCPHAALALDDAHLWPEGMHIESPVHVATERVALYRTGQIVRIRGMKHIAYIIQRRRFNGDGWQYGVNSLAGLPCGEIAEDRLELATNRKRTVR